MLHPPLPSYTVIFSTDSNYPCLYIVYAFITAKIASAQIQVGLAVSKAICNCRERHNVIHGTAPC